MKTYAMLMDGSFNIFKMIILHKMMYRFKTISIRISEFCVFCGNYQADSKIYMKI